MDAFWIIFTGLLIAFSGALLGAWLMVRRQSMMTDAISHAVLPGIVLAYLFLNERNSVMMLLAAALSGILATTLVSLVSTRLKIASEASIGLVYTLFFSIGVILVTQFAANVDLDLDCVLFGEIAYVPLNKVFLIEDMISVPPATLTVLITFIITSISLIMVHRILLLTSFDSVYASSIGFRPARADLMLMALVSLNTVAAFESVGSVLVLTFFSVPAATAFLFTRQMKSLMLWACVAGGAAVVAGYYFARTFNASIAPGMAVVSGIIFTVAVAVHLLGRNFHKTNLTKFDKSI